MMNKKWLQTGLSALVATLMAETALLAASGEDVVYQNVTLEERLYLFDGFGANWAVDVGSDGLWLVPDRPLPETYDAPFKLSNTAAVNSLVIGMDEAGKEGNVGIGTETPDASLDVVGDLQASDEMRVEWAGSNTQGDGMKRVFAGTATNSDPALTSDAGFTLKNGKYDKEWLFRTFNLGNGFSVSRVGTGGAEFWVVNNTGEHTNAQMHLGSGWYVDSNGQAHNASSRDYKENINDLSTQEAMDAFAQLKTVKYNFKRDTSKEELVGFIAEDVPALVATRDRKTVDPLQIVAVLNAVVHAQGKMLKTQAEKIAELEAKQQELSAVKARLSALENVLTNIAHTEALNREKAVSLLK